MDRHCRRFVLLCAFSLAAPFLDAQLSGPVTPGPLTVEWLGGTGPSDIAATPQFRWLNVHGTYDDNVHIQNAWRFADELIGANRLFEMMIYPMRMHGIADEPARIHLYNTMLDFWRRSL